ncbi:Short transient receptor putative channel 1 [Tyrophagus putrescentiae]|nr:Short transient receptor putative channel 1 [Tyrophagus putrescentiae]
MDVDELTGAGVTTLLGSMAATGLSSNLRSQQQQQQGSSSLCDSTGTTLERASQHHHHHHRSHHHPRPLHGRPSMLTREDSHNTNSSAKEDDGEEEEEEEDNDDDEEEEEEDLDDELAEELRKSFSRKLKKKTENENMSEGGGGRGDSQRSTGQLQQQQQQQGAFNQFKPLTLTEKRFLLAVVRGDQPAVRRLIHESRPQELNINCCDPLGRSGLLMAIDNENLEMIELLIDAGVEMKDALLHAINEEFVEAVELLLDQESVTHTPGTPHSWESTECETFTSDITPLVLAAHRNNYEIIKILLDRNISPIPAPHDARCGCKECLAASKEDCLRYSRSRINAYKALSSPSLIALSSKDPILTAFELAWQLRRLSVLEPEFKNEYLALRKQCQMFATTLLDHTRTSEELELLLNYDPNGDPLENHDRMQLSRLKLAISVRQKMFCAHANVQQLLASIWYKSVPGFRRRNIVAQTLQLIGIGALFPLLALAYILAPRSALGRFTKKPFIKFICHSASYVSFLVLLMLASQRIENNPFFGSGFLFNVSSTSSTATTTTTMPSSSSSMPSPSSSSSTTIGGANLSKRGALPSYIELAIIAWVLGLIWSEIKQLWDLGINEYMSDMWNILDFINNSLYVATITLRVIAYYQTQREIQFRDHHGLFATANIFSSLKLVYMFSVNPYLGPLQISLGRMVIDILKFFCIYLLVLFPFACGMNQLLWYYAEMEKQTCMAQPMMLGGNQTGFPAEALHPDACVKWRRFANLFESVQTLFWATFGLIDLDVFELTGIKSYTRFWAMHMFGVYSVINVAVLLNLLIAMMNHSYQQISKHADKEWKFARSKLWMSYFSDGATVPPPFNIIPTPKSLAYAFRWVFRFCLGQTKRAKSEAMKTIRRKQRKANERDYKYQTMVRSLIRRYILNEQRIQERQRSVTEDDCNEIKQDISALRYELLEMLRIRDGKGKSRQTSGGLGGSHCNTGNSSHFGRKSRQRERRLGFNWDFLQMDRVTAASFDEGEDLFDQSVGGGSGTLARAGSTTSSTKHGTHGHHHHHNKSPSTSTRSKFSRIAQNIASKRRGGAKWRALIEATRNKVIPFSRSQDSMDSNEVAGEEEEAINENVGGSSSNRSMKLDADVRRQIYALKLESVSLSQPALQSSSVSAAFSAATAAAAASSSNQGGGNPRPAKPLSTIATTKTGGSSSNPKQAEASNAVVQTKVLDSKRRGSANVASGGVGGGGSGVSGGSGGNGGNESGGSGGPKMPCDIITMKANDWI